MKHPATARTPGRRLLALLLSTLLLVGLLPLSVMAEGENCIYLISTTSSHDIKNLAYYVTWAESDSGNFTGYLSKPSGKNGDSPTSGWITVTFETYNGYDCAKLTPEAEGLKKVFLKGQWADTWSGVPFDHSGAALEFDGTAYYVGDSDYSTTPPGSGSDPSDDVTTTFIYEGSIDRSWEIAKWLGFKIFDGDEDETGFEMSNTVGTASGVTFAVVDNTTVTMTCAESESESLYVGEAWYNSGLDLKGQKCPLDGSTYYIYDDAISTTTPDQKAVAAVKAAIEEKLTTAALTFAQADMEATNADGIAAAVKALYDTTVEKNGVTVGDPQVTIGTDVVEGTSSNLNGTNGAFTFTIALSKGEAPNQATDTISGSGTITATAYVAPEFTLAAVGDTAVEVYVDGTKNLAVTATITTPGTPNVQEGDLAYQWYKTTADTAADGDAIANATATSYTVPATDTTATGTLKYYCVASAAGVTATSPLFTVEVKAKPVDNQALVDDAKTAVANAIGADPTVTQAEATDAAAIAAKLQAMYADANVGDVTVDTPNVTITKAATAGTATVTAENGTFSYSITLRKGEGAEEKTATISGTDGVITATAYVAPTISFSEPTEAQTVNVEQNATTTLTVDVSIDTAGTPAFQSSDLVYAWYQKVDGGEDVKINGAATAGYTPATSAVDTTVYYCVVKADNVTITSPAFTVNVSEPFVAATTTFVRVGDAPTDAKWMKFSVTDGTDSANLAATEAMGWAWSTAGADCGMGVNVKLVAVDGVDCAVALTAPAGLTVTWVGIDNTFSVDTQCSITDGAVYYVSNEAITTTKPDEPDKTTYTFTVHLYDGEGNGHTHLAGWMAKVESGTETAWSPQDDNVTGAFGEADSQGWKSVTASKDYANDAFNRLSFQTGSEANPFESGVHKLDFTGTSGEGWIIPGDNTVYATQALAQAALEAGSEGKIHYKYTVTHPGVAGEDWTVKSQLAKGDGASADDWSDYAAVSYSNPEPTAALASAEETAALTADWGTATLTWNLPDDETYDRVEFWVNNDGADTSYACDLPEIAADQTEVTGALFVVPGVSQTFTAAQTEALQEAIEVYETGVDMVFTLHIEDEDDIYQHAGAWLYGTDGGKAIYTKGVAVDLADDEEAGWKTGKVSWFMAAAEAVKYTRVYFQYGKDDAWESKEYSLGFDDITDAELAGHAVERAVWYVPGKTRPADTKADAQAMSNASTSSGGGVGAVLTNNDSYSFTVHYRGQNQVIGAWLAKVQGGSEVAWSEDGRSATAAFGSYDGAWSQAKFQIFAGTGFNRLAFQMSQTSPWSGPIHKFDFAGQGGEIWLLPGDDTIYTTKAAAEAAYAQANDGCTLTIHCCGKDYLLRGQAGQSDIQGTFQTYQNGWGQLAFAWNSGTVPEKVTFQVGRDAVAQPSYTYTLQTGANAIWVIPGDPAIYPSWAAAEAALAGGRVPSYHFTVHYKSAGGYVGAWLSRTDGGAEVDWAPGDKTQVVAMTDFDGMWSTAKVDWDLDGLYNRLSFQIGPDEVNLWNNLKYVYDFTDGGEVWVVPGDSTVYPYDPTGSGYFSTQSVLIDGASVQMDTYTWKDAFGGLTNYVWVRNLAVLLNDTAAHFGVDYDTKVNLYPGQSYTPTGVEGNNVVEQGRLRSTSGTTVNVNGSPAVLETMLLTDTTGGYSYYKLRDLGENLGFNVGWSAETGVYIQTDRPYDPNN